MDYSPDRLLERFLTYVAIDSESGAEGRMTDCIVGELKAMGYQPVLDKLEGAVSTDGGNVYVDIPGADNSLPPLLLCAHLDTVRPGKGISPVLTEDGYVVSAGDTILGGDDKSGVAALMELLEVLAQSQGPHRPLQVVFTVCEEMGLAGSRNLNLNWLRAKEAIVLDGMGHPGTVTTQAIGRAEMDITITGRAAHAGAEPERGVSAIAAAAAAVVDMPLLRIDGETTANIGSFIAQGVRNTVCDQAVLTAEIRSIRPEKLAAQIDRMEAAFNRAAHRYGATVKCETRQMYPPFTIAGEAPVVRDIRRASLRCGLPFETVTSGGGCDANILNQLGIQAVAVGIGVERPHTKDERLCVQDMIGLVQLLISIVAPDGETINFT